MMARLGRDQGKVQQARELLAPVYSWSTEGFDTRDLKEAKELLDTLTACGCVREPTTEVVRNFYFREERLSEAKGPPAAISDRG